MAIPYGTPGKEAKKGSAALNTGTTKNSPNGSDMAPSTKQSAWGKTQGNPAGAPLNTGKGGQPSHSNGNDSVAYGGRKVVDEKRGRNRHS